MESCLEGGPDLKTLMVIADRSSKQATALSLGALISTVFLSGCGSDAQEANFDRSDLFTEIASEINTNAPSDVSGLQGQATYEGVAIADFGGFGGTADANLAADFKTKTISGSLTSWEDLDPLNYELRGRVELTNGAIEDDGSFSTAVAGNIERTVLRGTTNPENVPLLKVFGGTAEGQIFDSNQGAPASHLIGAFSATDSDGGNVNGEFVARE
jgi:hypothetical protein